MFWVGKVFGKNSKEYKATVPDTTVWVNADSCLLKYSESYLTDPRYNYHPLVGITQEQAKAFCKWRSDRVLEGILVRRDVLKEDPNQNPQNYFSKERYFAGGYQGVKPDSHFLYYPNYRLPTIEEWKVAVYYEDSIEHKYKSKPLSPNIAVEPCDMEAAASVTKPFKMPDDLFDAASEKRHPLSNLKGNVSEWTSEKNVSIGGGWADKAEVTAIQDTFHLDGENAWTGFRCVCEWKEYKLK
jgi:formylglycine-generating enzyme required for sulfatase activity